VADNLAEIAENEGWGKNRKEDLNKIKILSRRLIDGVEEEGLSLSRMHITGLNRDYIRRLVGAGYGEVENMRDASEVELGKLLPKGLVQRIQKRMEGEKDIQKATKQKLIVEAEKLKAFEEIPKDYGIFCETYNMRNMNPQKNSISERQSATASPVTLLEPVLEISRHRPDRIIFEGKEIKVTTKAFLYYIYWHKIEDK